MRIEQTYYGDFRVLDEFPFGANDIISAAHKISREEDVVVLDWPVTIDHNDRTGYWEVWFTRPVSDEEYVNYIGDLTLE